MSLLDWVWPLLSALMGGFIGGWTVAFRLGSWRQRTEGRQEALEKTIARIEVMAEENREARVTNEQRLREIDKRLERGGQHIEDVPVLSARFEALTEELREIKLVLRQELPRLVSKEECQRRHEHG